MIVTGGENVGDFLKLLGSGREWGAKFTYRCQDGSGGIPVALSLAKEFAGDEKFVCILGDNIMEKSIKSHVDNFSKSSNSAEIFLQKVKDPKRYGIAEIKGNSVVKCFEKPDHPTTDLAVLGVYMFDSSVFKIIPNLKPSKRNELEITDILNHYIERKSLNYSILEGFWIDAGTFEALHQANTFISEKEM